MKNYFKYLILVFILAGNTPNSFSQKDTRQSRKYMVSINPVRIFFDEITVNFETRINKPPIYGTSHRYISPQERLGEKFT